ncbi:C1 family peptidase [Coleofasciculus sp. FACHB-1120]|uniref:C1 family peptidase n=1 Tax=Coleofasciculus sp. FACHB-1120 TaxID=2692783 RepID=UPI001684B068|nr:C1 family peptidase [Coleofasciculus sp. FACHB-1120]MBD2743284.1 C1 family peptidase [Coleofasciculus sp. FACHB-1120]
MPNLRYSPKVDSVQHSTGKKLKLGGYRPDTKDANDKKYAAHRFQAEKLPPRVDLRHYLTPVEDQGEVGSCTGNAMAGAYEYLAMRQLGTAGDVSRLFIYYNARSLAGEIEEDAGATLRNCIQVLRKMGACSELTWPYHPERLFHRPHDQAYEEATQFLIDDAERIDVDLYAMKHCLAEGYPFAFGLQLFDSFMREGNKGIPMPNPEREESQGGHAMLCVGYSDKDRVFVVRNSWGTNWGDKGYCYIPYDYMTNPEYCDDCWTIRSVTDLDYSRDVWSDDDASFLDDIIPLIADSLDISDSEIGSDEEEYEEVVAEDEEYVEDEDEEYVEDEEDIEDIEAVAEDEEYVEDDEYEEAVAEDEEYVEDEQDIEAVAEDEDEEYDEDDEAVEEDEEDEEYVEDEEDIEAVAEDEDEEYEDEEYGEDEESVEEYGEDVEELDEEYDSETLEEE